MSSSPGLSEVMASSNAQLVRLSEELGIEEPHLSCECGDSGCRERVAISAADYGMLVEEGRPMLAVAHSVQTVRSAEREEIERLRETVHHLQRALMSRVSIEQAKGVLVERHGMRPDDAFELLRRSARSSQRRLIEVCRELVDSAAQRGQPTV